MHIHDFEDWSLAYRSHRTNRPFAYVSHRTGGAFAFTVALYSDKEW